MLIPIETVSDMAAISPLQARDAHQLVRRSNWAGREAGVIVVFCVVFVVAVGLITVYITRVLAKRRAMRSTV